MTSSSCITLFVDPPPIRSGPSPFLVSMLVHGVVLTSLSLGLRRTPRLLDHSPIRPYAVRLLDPLKQETQIRWKANGVTASPVPRAVDADLAAGGKHIPVRSVAPQFEQLPKGLQSLIQPDAPPKLLPQQNMKLPVIVLWTPEATPPNKLVPPPPQEATVVRARPSIVPPNYEPTVADVKLSATLFPSKVPILSPSTTSPLVVNGPQQVKQLPQTSSVSVEQPTPAQMISLSASPSSQQTVSIPLANQTAGAKPTDSLREVHTDQPAAAVDGNSATKLEGAGAGRSAHLAANRPVTGTTSTGQGGADPTSDAGSNQGPVLGSEASVTHISLPKNGQFGIIVVGSSMAEQYPETVALWKGRMVYNVYLHVGVSKNWILQYAVPRVAEAAAAGNATRPDAPWPYEILRPNLAPGDENPDVLMVHGFVDVAGHFDQLALVSPSSFTQSEFVLNALRQWRFRPANQNGKIARVEVLLIMPQDLP